MSRLLAITLGLTEQDTLKVPHSHSWTLSEKEAIDLQRTLAQRVDLVKLADNVQLVAGVDVAYSKTTHENVAGVVLLEADSFRVVESAFAKTTTMFPYIPGLFSFRELPAVLGAIEKLENTPDLIICDGHGIAHPRRFGLASHLGVLLDKPTIGCAKTALLPCEGPLPKDRGATVDIYQGSDVVGKMLRTQHTVKPVYVSAGHKITLAESVHWVLKFSTKYRLPETTRKADQLVNRVLKSF